MEEVAFSEWPGQPVDLDGGGNPWLPAYGYQTPATLLEREDFLGNPDAEYFLSANGGASLMGGHYMYLETILEETSDDLRSEDSDIDSRCSPAGWFATDSEAESVICINPPDDLGCESDRELACPAKRRKQDYFLSIPSTEDLSSLSRSSSLVQFETLEKQCQEICTSSPSVYSQFSFDSLEANNRTKAVSPDSLNSPAGDDEVDYYKTLIIDVPMRKKTKDDSLLYNATRLSGSDSSDSDGTLGNSRSCDNLKTWRSFDSLPVNTKTVKEKISAENLSEDSGYSDHMTKSSSASNLKEKEGRRGSRGTKEERRGYVGFAAYDGDVFTHEQISGNFGISYHDLTIFNTSETANRLDSLKSPSSSIVMDHFAKSTATISAVTRTLKLDRTECVYNFRQPSCSEPDLLQACADDDSCKVAIENAAGSASSVPKDLNYLSAEDLQKSPQESVAAKDWNLADFLVGCKVAINTSAGSTPNVPKDLNYLLSGEDPQASLQESVAARDWNLGDFPDSCESAIDTSVENTSSLSRDLKYLSEEDPQVSLQEFDTARDWNLSDFPDSCKVSIETPVESTYNVPEDLKCISGENPQVSSQESDYLEDAKMAMTENAGQYRREGSYAEAMANRVDLSDDEHSLINRSKPKLPKHTIVEFDKRVLKAISEQSIQSIINSTQNLSINERHVDKPFSSTPISDKRNIASTPNLAAINQPDPDKTRFDEERRRSAYDIRRKNSVIKSSTSTSGLSDADEKTLSYAGSTNSKGVHFSPVVSEVNWRDSSISTVTPDRESSVYSLDSSSPERRASPPKEIHKAKPRRFAYSQPNLSDNDEVCKREFEDSLRGLREADYSKSQPDVSRLRRRGSQLVKKDKDGAVVRAYVDSDGVQYRHTHLDQGLLGGLSAALKHQQQSQLAGAGSVDAMQPTSAQREDIADGAGRRKRSGKIGGFFQRLTGLRFSLRKNESKKKEQRYGVGDGNANGAALLAPQQRVATKSDYIYIPLKGPPGGGAVVDRPAAAPAANGGGVQAVAAKPPLPKLPPRVVHVSVKQGSRGQLHDHSPPLSNTLAEPQQQSMRSHHHHRHHHQQQHRRHRTIDATPGGGHGNGGGSSLANASPIGVMNSTDIAGANALNDHRCVGGLLETDIDTQVTVVTSANGTKARSLLDLGDGSGGRNRQQLTLQAGEERRDRPHKSMEFLLDKENLRVVEPPENELQKGERVMSEHQLRVQRSLQKLTVPEWYRQSQVPREGFLLKKNSPRETRWAGTTAASKTTSLSSLGSNTQSPVVLSPTPCNQPFVRWSTSKLNSTASSPCASTRSSFNTRQPNGSISPSSVRSSFSYRQPYLGWRSQERLNRPRTPAERLANSLLNSQNAVSHQVPPQPSPEIQTSIKEVTSAIVHYVSGLHPPTSQQEVEGGSPRGSTSRLCWLESSFVGSRPPDSPETPVAINETTTAPPVGGSPPAIPSSTGGLRLELQAHNEVTLVMSSTTGAPHNRPSPGSATLEDVLDSLLGLPSSGRAPSPSLQGMESANTSPCPPVTSHQDVRRRSDGSDACSEGSRRQSMTSSPVLRCRYARCGRATLATSEEASAFKNCHNCSYTYCSRACRRAHWEKHRKTCLFSRIGSLCRQVIASAKEQKDTLMHLSKIARRGYLSQGLGAVKCFFPNLESAESFLTHGLSHLGEMTYVRWQDLLPSEMGPQLYTELVKMCKLYNPESKLILYVCVCVISETPAVGAVKWERQLVSRCAKMRLSKEEQSYESLETLILTSSPLMGDTFTVRELRTRCVDNLQGHLRIKGVSLKKHHPEIHRQLTAYVEDATVQLPTMTVFPKDSFTGKSFMCVIMLEVNQKSVKEVEGTRGSVRTIDVMRDVFGSV